VGRFKAALTADGGVGKGPLFMAEELAFDEGLRDGGAVYLHKSPIRPGGKPVNRLGHQLFSGPVFPGDQDPGIGVGGLFYQVPNLGNGRARSDDIVL
jgi:hypothetical protein